MLKKAIKTWLIPFLLLLVLLIEILLIPAPTGNRTSTNACMGGVGCHSSDYAMYIYITSYNVSSFFNEDWRKIQCNFSITGNMNEKDSKWHYYYDSNITVTATSNNGLLQIQGSPVYFYMKAPGFNGTANFTAKGIGNGSDSVRFEVKMVPWHKSINCMRTEVTNAPTNVKINVPPIISNGYVTPNTGSIKMKYNYEITYLDADGDSPKEIFCKIDNKNYNLSVKDGVEDSIKTGEIYNLTLLGSLLGMGTEHTYFFKASDGKFDAIGDTVVRNGPNINLLDSLPSCEITYPLDGIHSGELNISGTAVDLDEGEEIESVELSFRDGPWVLANGTNNWHMDLDLFLWNDGAFKIKARAFNGDTYSNIAERTITIDNSFSNSPPTLKFELSNNTIIGPFDWINGTLSDPELPNQDITVFVGLSITPNLIANISGSGQIWSWSLQMNLTDLDEGNFKLYAIAQDPYVCSNVKILTLILDKPNILPLITIDEIPDPVWGTVDLMGHITDVDNFETDLKIQMSFDNLTWYPVNITGGKWKVRINFSYFDEKEYTLYLKCADLEGEILIKKIINVQGPYEIPIIIDSLPISPAVVNVDENLTFTVFYRARDHRGTIIKWLVDTIEVLGKNEDNITELDINFSEIGDHEITIIVLNAEAPKLFSSYTWQLDVKAVLILEPLCETLINSIVGEVIILQYGVKKGEVKEITWTVNGNTADGNDYFYYVPETAGKHIVKVTINDKYGNIGFIEYTIEASLPPGSEIKGENEDKDQINEQESKRAGRFVIAGIGIFLIIVIIISIFLIFQAITKRGQGTDMDIIPDQMRIPQPRHGLEPKPEPKPEPKSEPAPKPKLPVTFNPQQVQVKTQPLQTTYYQPQQQIQPVIQQPSVQTLQQTQQYQQPQQVQRYQLPRNQPTMQLYLSQPQPSFSPFSPKFTCPFCKQLAQYLPAQNRYWCIYCQRFL